MALTGYKMQTTTIPLPGPGGDTFEVRGLNIEDFSILLANNLEALSKAADLYVASKNDIFATANFNGFLLTVAKDFPGIVSEVISIAADEPGARDTKIPLAAQMAALSEIGRLTIQEAGGLGNLLAVLGVALKSGVSGKFQESLKAVISHVSTGASEKT